MGKKKYFYANGSSVTAGGGFEEYKYRTDIRDAYKNQGIELPDTQLECSYPYMISKILGLECINDSKSGSGIDRLVRRTFEWIVKNQDKLEETIIFLEPQSGIRLDWYVNEWQDYGVLNAHKNEKGEYPFTLVKDWFHGNPSEQVIWNQKYKSAIDGYLINFFDGDVQFKNELDRLTMLVGFLNNMGIDYIISIPGYIEEEYNSLLKKIVPFKSNLSNKLGNCVWEYSRSKKLLISNEVSHTDNHIGFNGNIHISEQISDFIKNYKEITYFAFESIQVEDNYIFKNKSIKFKRIDDIKTCDFVYVSDCMIFDSTQYLPFGKYSEFKDRLETKYHIESIKYKNLLILLQHERLFKRDFILFLDFLIQTYGIKKSQIFCIDSSISDHRYTNIVPLELKMKMYHFHGYNINNTYSTRSKKITMLSRKLDATRIQSLDRLIYGYSSRSDLNTPIHKLLKFENNITAVHSEKINKLFTFDKSRMQSFLKNDISLYKNIELPWKMEDYYTNLNDKDIDIFFNHIVNLHSNSIFSIVNETRSHELSDAYFDWIKNYELPDDFQFSEKSLLPLLSETFVFFVTDGLYYKYLENLGFDFSYLTKLFNIDYLTNTTQENIESIYIISKFVSNKSIDELNKFRNDNIKYLKHNRDIMTNILFGDYSINELKFFEKLSNRKLF